nr:cellulose binding domain-containing protein [Saccharothrix sp. ALI-22-I]
MAVCSGAAWGIFTTWTSASPRTASNEGNTAVNGWNVEWTLGSGQTVTQVWNGTLNVSGSTASVRNASYNGSLQANTSTAAPARQWGIDSCLRPLHGPHYAMERSTNLIEQHRTTSKAL